MPESSIADDVATDFDAVITLARQGCVSRSDGFCHVYLEGVAKCCCGNGPELNQLIEE